MSATKTILVTGATGRQGGAVVNHLLKNNIAVKALSRTPQSLSASLLSSKGVEVVKGDMSDIASLTNAMKGCDGVFSVQNFFEYGGEKEVAYGKNLIDAARQSDISHFVYSSVCSADKNTGVPHFETKNVIEGYLKKSGVPFTILRPVKFMENYYIPQVFRGILGGKLLDAILSGKKHQMLATDDIGKYAAVVFQHPEIYISKIIEIAGDELTNEEVASTISEVIGIKVKFSKIPMPIVRLVMDKEMYLMFRWFNEKGFEADRKAMATEFHGVNATSLKEFLLNENWQRWNKKGSV
jgi:uncharacterized protein YbjT (DUF2867 family)